jgi:hypothetical protein
VWALRDPQDEERKVDFEETWAFASRDEAGVVAAGIEMSEYVLRRGQRR